MDPNKPDKGLDLVAQKHADVVWIQFKDSFDADDISAETLASLFSQCGDFHVFKDSLKSCIVNFYYIDRNYINCKTPQGFIELMRKPENLEKYHIKQICQFDEAPKFVAHNHLE